MSGVSAASHTSMRSNATTASRKSVQMILEEVSPVRHRKTFRRPPESVDMEALLSCHKVDVGLEVRSTSQMCPGPSEYQGA